MPRVACCMPRVACCMPRVKRPTSVQPREVRAVPLGERVIPPRKVARAVAPFHLFFCDSQDEVSPSRDGGLKGRLALIILAPASANLHRNQPLCRRRPQTGSRWMVAAPSPAKVQRGLILPTMPAMPCTAKSEAASTCTRQVAQRRPARARRLSRLRGPATVSTSGRRAPGSPATSFPRSSWRVVVSLFKGNGVESGRGGHGRVDARERPG